MGLIGEGAVIGINEGDQVVDENALESAEVKPASTGTGDAAKWGAVGRASRSRRATWAGTSGNIAIGHHDNEGLGFPVGDQVVHNQTSVTLAAPAGFIFPAAVLQVQHRITPGQILFIVRGRVNEAAEGGISALGIGEGVPQLTLTPRL